MEQGQQDRIELKCPLKSIQAMKTKDRGNCNLNLDADNHIILVQWNDNSIITMASNITGVYPVQKAHRWSTREKDA